MAAFILVLTSAAFLGYESVIGKIWEVKEEDGDRDCSSCRYQLKVTCSHEFKTKYHA